jgi:hypothetical protein
MVHIISQENDIFLFRISFHEALELGEDLVLVA